MSAFVRNVFATLPAGNQTAALIDQDFSDVHDGIQNGSLVTVGTIAGTNSITGTTAVGPPAALAAGQYVFFTPAATNTGAVTFSRDGLTAKSVLQNATALTGGELRVNVPSLIFYDGTNYHIIGSVPGSVTSPQFAQGRLTLTTAVPVTTSDVTGATTIFFTPYAGNQISTFNGSAWRSSAFSEKSLSVPATTSQMYDIFIVDGTLALEALAWTNDTTRATALVLQDGVLVKSGDATRRYLGSFRTTGVSGQTEDSIAKRYVWNYYNRALRKMLVQEATANWTYTTATFRQANANAANQLDFVVGVQENPVKATALGSASNSATAQVEIGIGVDSTTVNSADIFPLAISVNATTQGQTSAAYQGFPGIGRHTLAWLEWSFAAGTTTWYGSGGAGGGIGTHSGIAGELWG